MTWTRAHDRFAAAWARLSAVTLGSHNTLPRWLYCRWRVRAIGDLTTAQARSASRQVNAWRGGVEGYTTTWGHYPRQWARNQRRAREARGG